MISKISSKNGIPIRLTDERWAHITEEHCEMAGLRTEVLETVYQADKILAGSAGEKLAVRQLKTGKFLVVVYREFLEDGFVITAFLTSRSQFIERRTQLWP